MPDSQVRVRFAPSPTGPLHIGGVRTALYNYLYARKHQGRMILRIEDTDKTRFVERAEDYIRDALTWCGIDFDEGPHIGGKYGPYRQSERKELYDKYVNELLDSGHAYYAFDTPEELDAMRERLKEKGVPNPQYDFRSRGDMKNSLTLTQEETESLKAEGTSYVIRFRMREDCYIIANDIVRGEISVNSSTMDDKVLVKRDGMPTYHLANIIDDYQMKITHVIRGEEWLPSLPLHISLYQALGWEPPQFAHLPLLLKPEGKGKLSKRDGDRLGFPVFPTQWKNPETGETAMGYREEGYLPEAFINIIAMLGWNPGDEQELFSMEELINRFKLEKVQKGGASFAPEKAKWYNHQYLRKKDDSELGGEFVKIAAEHGYQINKELAEKIVSLVKERINFPQELWDQSWFLFQAPEEFDPKSVKKKWKADTPEILKELKSELEKTADFKAENIKAKIQNFVASKELGFSKVMVPLRISIVGTAAGPDLTEVMEIIGKEEVLKRIDYALEKNPA